MRKIVSLLSITVAASFFSACVPVNTNAAPYPYQAAPVGAYSYQTFYDDLSPYGYWINYPGYGYVWSPNVGPEFEPYVTNGQWVYSDYGWTWMSGYSWGWAPFHYGRWFYQDGYGWLWMPDTEWAPAWVVWGQSSGYYGWAPLPPRAMVASYNPPVSAWTFVLAANMANANVGNYRMNSNAMRGSVSAIRNNSFNNRNLDYNRGPQANDVARNGRIQVRPVTINESNRPGASLNNNRLDIYRPTIQNNNSSNNRPAPRQVQQYNAQQRAPQQVAPQQPVQITPQQNEPQRISPAAQPPQAPTQPQPSQQSQPPRSPERISPRQQAPQTNRQPDAAPQQQRPPTRQIQRSEPAQQRPPRQRGPALQQPPQQPQQQPAAAPPPQPAPRPATRPAPPPRPEREDR